MFAIFLCRVPRGEVIKSVPYSAARPLIVRRKKCHYYWQVIRLLKTFNIKKPSHRVLNKKLSSSEMPRRDLHIWYDFIRSIIVLQGCAELLCGKELLWCRLTWHRTAPCTLTSGWGCIISVRTTEPHKLCSCTGCGERDGQSQTAEQRQRVNT